jgi:hypothetical protein
MQSRCSDAPRVFEERLDGSVHQAFPLGQLHRPPPARRAARHAAGGVR